MSPHPESVQARAERLLRSYEGITVMPRPGLGLLGSDEECAVVRDLLAELSRVTQERDRLRDYSSDLENTVAYRSVTRLERDLAALRQERDDWRQAFETANEAIGKMELSHAQAIREAFAEAAEEVTARISELVNYDPKRDGYDCDMEADAAQSELRRLRDGLAKLSSPDYVVVKREDAEAIVKTLDACYRKEARALLGLSDSEGT